MAQVMPTLRLQEMAGLVVAEIILVQRRDQAQLVKVTLAVLG
jgi:hypothetical protein